MKHFVYKLSRIAGVSLVIFCVIYALMLHCSRLNTNFKISSAPMAVILGHSHPECAFNDNVFLRTKNLASSGESYFYTYLKFRNVFKENPSIKYAFIEFTNNQILENKDAWIYENVQIDFRYPEYAPVMKFEEQFLILQNNPVGYINGLSLSVKKNINVLFNEQRSFKRMGGFNPLSNISSSDIGEDNAQEEIKSTWNTVCETNLLYLDKLIKFCKSQDIVPILIRSPLHPNYPKQHNEEQFLYIKQTRFSELEFLDFSKYQLHKSDYADLEHLNHKGATKFSNWFRTAIEDSLDLVTHRSENLFMK